MVMLEGHTTILNLHGDLQGRYVLEERRPDGAMLIRPDLPGPAILNLHGDLEGRYVLEERRPDGAMLIRPDLSGPAIREREATGEEVPAFLRERNDEDIPPFLR